MDCAKVGNFIYRLRRERGMTQKQLAERLSISDKTVSKWERGLGCPDVSLLGEVSAVLGTDIERLLSGSLDENDKDGGNMKRTKFYVCPVCGNCIAATGSADVSCCGRKLAPLEARAADGDHEVKCEEVEDDCYVTFGHEMTKEHYIAFAAYLSYDRLLFIRLYPEGEAAVRFPSMHSGELYFYCTRHGLMKTKI